MRDLSTYTIVTSNNDKAKEFINHVGFMIPVEVGKDIREVFSSNIETVAIYKALEAGKNKIIEDTALHIDGVAVGVNVKWMLDTIEEHQFKGARWEVCIALNDGDSISLYKGITYGTIVPSKEDKFNHDKYAFGFDKNFRPYYTSDTLHELSYFGKKDKYSARMKAVMNLLHDNPSKVIKIKDIEEWNGSYQND